MVTRLNRRVILVVVGAWMSLSLSQTSLAEVCDGPFCARYGIDTDGGIQPEIPGCTKTSTASNCANAALIASDYCDPIEPNYLVEQESTAACTKNADASFVKISCNQYCQENYGQVGTCGYAPVTDCVETEEAAYCQCSDF